MPSFEARSDRSGRAAGVGGWEEMLCVGLRRTARLESAPAENPLRALPIVYTDEFYEGTSRLGDRGLSTLPLAVESDVLGEAGINVEKL